jgi:hypothetical protein
VTASRCSLAEPRRPLLRNAVRLLRRDSTVQVGRTATVDDLAECGQFRTLAPFNSMEESGHPNDIDADISRATGSTRPTTNLSETPTASSRWEPAASDSTLSACRDSRTMRTDASNSTTKDNTMTSNSLKAQGMNVMHRVLTGSSLRNC